MAPSRRSKRSKGRKPLSVPFPWDASDPRNIRRIEDNYVSLRRDVVDAALEGHRPSLDQVRDWHRRSLAGVPLAEAWVAGGLRGEGPPNSKLRASRNHVNGIPGADPRVVHRRVVETFAELDRRLDILDRRVAGGQPLSTLYKQVLHLCAWVHGEWIRIHPFVDHNGSTARLLTLTVGLRFGIPLRLPGKPRSALPTGGLALSYELAAQNQMLGDDALMVALLDQLVHEATG